jgi:hypothetical protein
LIENYMKKLALKNNNEMKKINESESKHPNNELGASTGGRDKDFVETSGDVLNHGTTDKESDPEVKDGKGDAKDHGDNVEDQKKHPNEYAGAKGKVGGSSSRDKDFVKEEEETEEKPIEEETDSALLEQLSKMKKLIKY